MKDPLPIGDALRFGYEGMKKHFFFLFGLFFLYYVVQFGASIFLVLLLDHNSELATLLGYLISLVGNVILTTGSVAISLKICDGLKPQWGDFICEGKVLAFNFLAILVITPMLVIGFILLIFPGIYMALRLGQAIYFIVEQKENPIDAIKKSWEATEGMAGSLFLYYLAAFGILLGGFFLLLIGLIPAWFVTMIASAYLYRVLNQRLMTRNAVPSASSATLPASPAN